MVNSPQPRRGFQTPPEVTGYFADKGLRPAFSWADVWGEEHAYAFTVAKATELELLTAFKTSIGKALTDGQGFETWRKGMIDELHRLGWGGPRTVTDPTGAWSPADVDFTDARRLRTIFWSNVNAARSAGQWERAQRTKAALPYALYVRTASTDPRKEHLGWVGIILPIDDPWWRTHWPPNGWGCKCSIRMITGRERDRLLAAEPKPGGITYRDTPPDDGPPKVFVNRRSGEISEIPAGIDPGWQTNPGLSRARTLVTRLSERLAEAGEDDARAAIGELWQTPMPRIVSGLPASERIQLPVAVAPEAAKALDASSHLVSVSRDTLAEKLGRHRDRPTEMATFAEVQELIDAGTLVDRGQPNRRSVVTEREDGWWNTAIARSAAGFMRIVSVHRVRAEQALKWMRKEADGRP
ncbi:phage head morphogenesis protein [Methylorubrum zatmanii]